MIDWALQHAPGWQWIIAAVMLQAILLVAVRQRRLRTGGLWVFVGVWLSLFAFYVIWSPALRYTSEPPRLAAWLLALGVGTLGPIAVAQVASALGRAVRSNISYGALIFACGVFMGIPLLALTGSTLFEWASALTRTVR
jgi:H+/gluconate symporter-like permease